MGSRRIACTGAVASSIAIAIASAALAGCATEDGFGAASRPPLVTEITVPPESTTTASPESTALEGELLVYEAAATIEVGYTLSTGFTVDAEELSALNPAVTFRRGTPDSSAESGVVWITSVGNLVVCLSLRAANGVFTNLKDAVAGPLPSRTVDIGMAPPGPCDDVPYGALWDGPPDPAVNLCPARHQLVVLGAFDGTRSLVALSALDEPGNPQAASQAEALARADRVLERSTSNVPVTLRDDWEYLRGRLADSRTAILDGSFDEVRPTIFDDDYTRIIAELATYVDGLPCLADDDLRPSDEADDAS